VGDRAQAALEQPARRLGDERVRVLGRQAQLAGGVHRRGQRRRAARPVGVGGDQPGAAAAQHPHRVAARSYPVQAGERGGADLRQRAERQLAPQAAHLVVEQRVATLRVGEHDPVAGVAQLVGGAVERRDRAVERRLQEDPAGAGGAVGDPLQLGRAEAADAARRQLSPALHRQRDARVAQRVVDLGDARGDLRDVDGGDMGRGGRGVDPVRDLQPGQLQRRVEVGRTVVHSGQQVDVQIDETVGHVPL